MRSILLGGVAALSLSVFAGQALAQMANPANPSTTPPTDTSLRGQPAAPMTTPPATTTTPSTSDASEPTSAAATPPASDTATASAGMTTPAVGMSVKDKSGAVIGQISEINPGADGKPAAVIKMDTGSFTVAAASIGMTGGQASVNATKADIEAMIKAAKPAG